MSFVKSRAKIIQNRQILGNRYGSSQTSESALTVQDTTTDEGLKGTAAENLTAGNVGYLDDDGKIYESTSLSTDGKIGMGFIGKDAVTNDDVTLLNKTGEIITPTIELTGKFVYLRSGTINISNKALTRINQNEDIYQIVGRNVNGMLMIDIKEPKTHQKTV